MKQQRHSVIREIVQRTQVTSQDDLRRHLLARGFDVAQATLSRDIHQLQLSKGPEGYVIPRSAQADSTAEADVPRLRELLRTFGQHLSQAVQMLVLNTSPGAAQPVAAGLDAAHFPEVLGTIAGDDTVLIICPDAARASILKARIEPMLA